MKEIVEALKKRISENKNSMLVTVVAGRGSIPRKAGAYMVVGEDGRVTGTIGGGNLEYQATLLGQKLLTEKKNYLHEYNLVQEKSAELGMALNCFGFLAAVMRPAVPIVSTEFVIG